MHVFIFVEVTSPNDPAPPTRKNSKEDELDGPCTLNKKVFMMGIKQIQSRIYLVLIWTNKFKDPTKS